MAERATAVTETSPISSRDNPIIVRCGISRELTHFDYVDPATGRADERKCGGGDGGVGDGLRQCVLAVVRGESYIGAVWRT